MPLTIITPDSSNKKLGLGVATTYRPVGDASKGEGTCPSNCKHLQDRTCYAMKKLVNMNQKRARDRADELDRLAAKGARFVRLHTSGDFFCASGLDTEYLDTIIAWCNSHLAVTVWTYCHDVAALIAGGYSYAAGAFPRNLHIVASCDTDEQRELAKAHGFRTARTIPEPIFKAEDETLCPYDLQLHQTGDPTTTCAKCTLCFNPKHKKDIAFVQH